MDSIFMEIFVLLLLKEAALTKTQSNSYESFSAQQRLQALLREARIRNMREINENLGQHWVTWNTLPQSVKNT